MHSSVLWYHKAHRKCFLHFQFLLFLLFFSSSSASSSLSSSSLYVCLLLIFSNFFFFFIFLNWDYLDLLLLNIWCQRFQRRWWDKSGACIWFAVYFFNFFLFCFFDFFHLFHSFFFLFHSCVNWWNLIAKWFLHCIFRKNLHKTPK